MLKQCQGIVHIKLDARQSCRPLKKGQIRQPSKSCTGGGWSQKYSGMKQ